MRNRETLVGLLVVGLIAAGVLWVRRPAASLVPAAAPGTSTSAESSELLGPWPSGPGSTASDPVPPDITVTDGVVDLGEVRVTLSVAPRPPVAFAKRFYRVRVESQGAAAKLEDGRISFAMKMPMGDHRYALVPGAEGWQEAVVVLPLCGSGDPRWYALVEGTVSGRPAAARFRLDLAR